MRFFRQCGLLVLILFSSFTWLSCSKKSTTLANISQVGEFEFLERSQKKLRREDLKGNIWIANFFFTGCSSQCQQLTDKMAQLQRTFAEDTDIKLVSFTVDPDTDTVDVLKRFADKYQAREDKWLFVTGDKTKLHTFIQKSFLLPASDNPNAGLKADDDFIHSEIFALVDRTGMVRAYYDGLDPSLPKKIEKGVATLLAEEAGLPSK